MKNNKLVKVISLYASNAMIYAFNALFFCFLPIYFNMKFTPAQAGILLSIGPAVSIAVPMFWGVCADRAKYKNSVLIFNVLASAVFFFLLKNDFSFFPMCLMVGAVMVFMSAHSALLDSITLEYSTSTGLAYGPVRMMGTLGFGMISLVSSFFTENNIRVIFYIFAGMSLVCSAVLLLAPQIKGHAHTAQSRAAAGKEEKPARFDLRPLLSDKKLWMIIFFMFSLQFSYAYYCNYYPTYLTETLAQPSWVWGLTVLLTVSGEIPFFMLYNKLFSRFGIRILVLVTMVLSVLRYVLLGFVDSVLPLMVINVLTGFLVTVLTYCGATYIAHCIIPELQATGQNLLYCAGQSVPRMLGGIVGGLMQTAFGTSGSMFICAGLTAVTTVFALIFLLPDKSKEMGPLSGL